MLTKKESPSYVAYLQAKKVTINEIPAVASNLSCEAISHIVKKELLCSDKGLLDKATQAFVSFIRYYKEH